ncbi:transposase [Nitrosomonas sp. Nm58]|uniref:transposase n=1 Tax=Nitrosomonas sp. Nm58 TaxID=200126 RepID=UPI0015A5223E|nr:transposase [Nitrosomonas sp. Nm58]
MVDTLGHLIQLVVHAANIHDTKAAPSVLRAAMEKSPRISAFSSDAGYYRGTTVDFVEQVLGWEISGDYRGIMRFEPVALRTGCVSQC